MKQTFVPFLLFYILLAACASLTTPTGGPKDVKPPELVQSIPPNKQANYKGKSVTLEFDEDVKLNNPREEIIISPSPGKEVSILAKKNKVVITPTSGWKDSTTYSILFREGIQDITESNTPVNLKLAFSTGTTIDSLSISGTVIELLKGEPLEKITVAIFASDTFDIFRHTPSYFTKTNKKGLFTLDNIKEGQYFLYAFDDKNKNLKVESRTERYGFIANPLQLERRLDSLLVGLVMLDSRPLKTTSIRTIGNVTRIRFNKYLTDYSLQGDSSIVHAFGSNNTEINIWVPENTPDSIALQLTAKDSIDSRIDTILYAKVSKTKPVSESFKWSLGKPTVDPQTGTFTTTLTFNKPVVNIDFDSLYIELDSVNRATFSNENFDIDTKQKSMAITKTLDKSLFKGDVDPQLLMRAGKGFLYSIENDSSPRLSSSVNIQWADDAGVLFIQTLTNQKDYLVQLLDARGKILKSVPNITKYTFDKLTPGEYQLRAIIDTNKNGKWDAGNYTQHIEPEKVVFYKTDEGKYNFPIRANWELGPLILKF